MEPNAHNLEQLIRWLAEDGDAEDELNYYLSYPKSYVQGYAYAPAYPAPNFAASNPFEGLSPPSSTEEAKRDNSGVLRIAGSVVCAVALTLIVLFAADILLPDAMAQVWESVPALGKPFLWLDSLAMKLVAVAGLAGIVATFFFLKKRMAGKE